MTHTTIPTSKGQITIPAAIRKKYSIDEQTPVLISDKGNGMITLKIMHMVPHDDIKFYETDEMTGMQFKRGIDPQVLINKINEIDGQD